MNGFRARLFACTERESICLELSSVSYAGDLNEVTSTRRRSLPIPIAWTEFIMFGPQSSRPLITEWKCKEIGFRVMGCSGAYLNGSNYCGISGLRYNHIYCKLCM